MSNLTEQDRKEMEKLFADMANSNRREAEIYFGGDSTPEAKTRNAKRQKHQAELALKYDRWATAIASGE